VAIIFLIAPFNCRYSFSFNFVSQQQREKKKSFESDSFIRSPRHFSIETMPMPAKLHRDSNVTLMDFLCLSWRMHLYQMPSCVRSLSGDISPFFFNKSHIESQLINKHFNWFHTEHAFCAVTE
jgi:hypothetical protein